VRSTASPTALTREVPAPGLVVYQPRRGFRFSLDPFALAGWALEGGRPDSFLEVGHGSGILSLLLLRLGIAGQAVDVRPEWVKLARRSAVESGLPEIFRCADVRQLAEEHRARQDGPAVELVLCNPPYFPVVHGRVPADPVEAAARHELHGTVPELIAAMTCLGRRVALIVPRGRVREAAAALEDGGRPVRRRCDLGKALSLLEGAAGLSRPSTAVVRQEVADYGPDGPSAAVARWYERLDATLQH